MNEEKTGTYKTDVIKFVPKYVAQKCPVCNGYGTLKHGTIKCHGCDGKGYVIIPNFNNYNLEDLSKNADRTDNSIYQHPYSNVKPL